MLRKAQEVHKKTENRLKKPKNGPKNWKWAKKVKMKIIITNDQVTIFFISPTLIFMKNWLHLSMQATPIGMYRSSNRNSPISKKFMCLHQQQVSLWIHFLKLMFCMDFKFLWENVTNFGLKTRPLFSKKCVIIFMQN